ncbi:MAG: glycosyltransferase [Pseudomonadota bacterium]
MADSKRRSETIRHWPVRLPQDALPRLLVIVDAEEEFDWTAPFDRRNTATRSIAEQWRAQEIFEAVGAVPTYLIDYPVATAPLAVETLKAFHDNGRCLIGAQMHPWVNPPFEEEVNIRNSYPGNLAPGLEREKLSRLSQAIEQNFGFRPWIYKAGRYGLGRHSVATLKALGYRIDMSVVPHVSFSADDGPSFLGWPDQPFWWDAQRTVLEIPLSSGFSGLLSAYGAPLYPLLMHPLARRLHAPGIFSRAHLLSRATLTPEGAHWPILRRLMRNMVKNGVRVFSLTYHSPSLGLGHTPYVRDTVERAAFLETIGRILKYFRDELGGVFSTPDEIHSLAVRQSAGRNPS